MKKTICLLLGVAFTVSLFGQNLPTPLQWKIKKFGISFGYDEDMISNLDYRYMLSTARNVDQSKYAGMEFAPEDLYSGVCENPNIRVNVALEVPRLKNVELNVGLAGVFDRYDGVYYSSRGNSWDYMNGDYEYLGISSLTNEIALESSITKRLSAFNCLNIYVGGGTNLGYAFGGHMTVTGHSASTTDNNIDRTPNDIVGGNYEYEYLYDRYELKNSLHQRAFAQFGLSFILFKRLELGLDYRRGIGYRASADSPTKTTRLNSLSTSIRWVLR